MLQVSPVKRRSPQELREKADYLSDVLIFEICNFFLRRAILLRCSWRALTPTSMVQTLLIVAR